MSLTRDICGWTPKSADWEQFRCFMERSVERSEKTWLKYQHYYSLEEVRDRIVTAKSHNKPVGFVTVLGFSRIARGYPADDTIMFARESSVPVAVLAAMDRTELFAEYRDYPDVTIIDIRRVQRASELLAGWVLNTITTPSFVDWSGKLA